MSRRRGSRHAGTAPVIITTDGAFCTTCGWESEAGVLDPYLLRYYALAHRDRAPQGCLEWIAAERARAMRAHPAGRRRDS